MKSFPTFFVLAIFVVGSACTGHDEPKTMKKANLQDPQIGDAPSNSTVITTGSFTSFEHGLSGDVTLYLDAQGNRTLTFKNFNMAIGPDVYVLLSKTNNYSEANAVPISTLKKGYSGSSLNFNVAGSIDIRSHNFVLVYCVQYHSLFGYCELKQ
jgi:hypothetical protein